MSAAVDGQLVEAPPTSAARMLQLAVSPAGRTAAKLLVSAALLVVIFNRVDLSESGVLLGGSALWPILCVWALQSALPFVQAQRWRAIVAALGSKLPYASAIKNVYIGQFFNQVLPSSIGGDAIRMWKSARLMPASTALSSVALDRLVALLAVPIILAIGSGMLLGIVPAGPFRWALCAMMAAAGCAILLLLWADKVPLPRVLARRRIVNVVRSLPGAMRRLLSDPGCLARTLALSIVIHLGVGTSLWALTSGFGVDAPIGAFLLLAPLVTLVTTVPISVGGWGVREGAMVTALSFLQVPAAVALAVSVQFGLIMMVVGLPGGVLAFLDRAGGAGRSAPREA